MKLKYKLFFSYLVLIIFISIALFLLILQLKGIDHFVRSRIEQDVQEMVDLYHQQQILEDVYAQYLLALIPNESKEKYQKNLEISINEYIQNWQRYKLRRETVDEFTFFPHVDYFIKTQVVDSTEQMNEFAEKESLENQCELYWNSAWILL